MVHQEILEQYDSKQGLQFYRVVMGDFDFNIHYGIYHNLHESMKDAAEQTIAFMANTLIQHGVNGPCKVADLGAGTGGAAHYLALKYGWDITCVNIGKEQNKQNAAQVKKLGIENLVTVANHNFEQLPEAWTDTFDVVWSEEAFCHAIDKEQVLKEAQRILAPGGILIFSDIMEGEAIAASNISTFSDRNAVKDLAKIQDYTRWSLQLGFQDLMYKDLTKYLPLNFQKMIDQIDVYQKDMINAKVDQEYLANFRKSLVDRIEATKNNNFNWGVFMMKKAPAIQMPALNVIVSSGSTTSVVVEELNQENLGALGVVFEHADWNKIEVPLVSWPSKTGRPLVANTGKGQIVEGAMKVYWEKETLYAANEAINKVYKDVAYKDEKGAIYVEWFNSHEDGGQAFYCKGKKLLYILAPNIPNPSPQDFRALVADGSNGVLINPGVWHTNPIPLEEEEVLVLSKQSTIDATVDCRLLQEHTTWLKFEQ